MQRAVIVALRCSLAGHARVPWALATLYHRFRLCQNEGILNQMLKRLHLKLNDQEHDDQLTPKTFLPLIKTFAS